MPGLDDPGDKQESDVQYASGILNELTRELSRRSARDPEEKDSTPSDVEKGVASEEQFDLREYLKASNDEDEHAGVKPKHVGVTWEDLQVEVVGGSGYKVSTE